MLKMVRRALACSLLVVSCQPPATDIREPQVQGGTPPPPMATATPAPDPLSRALLTAVPEYLPTGFSFNAVEPDRARANKVNVILSGPFGSQRISYTIYPATAEALSAFALVGEVPRERNVVSTEPLTPLGMAGQVWGETSSEEYEGKRFTRTSLAVPVGRVITLAQIAIPEGPSPEASDATIALLKAAIAHVRPMVESDEVPVAAPTP